jgi:uncharacterized protein YdaT
MKSTELRSLIREEIKKILTAKRATVKTSLKEGYAWERKPGKPLPTLAEVQAEHLKNLKEEEDDTWNKEDDYGSKDLDSSKGGTDSSMNKIHSALVKVQKEMDKVLADYKAGKITKDHYIAKRKPLQAKRDKLENSL